MKEVPLADLLPLWRTLREDDVTALVTPALDYVGAVEVTTVDVRFASGAAIESLGEQLRSVLAAADDGWTLHFLARTSTDCDSELRDYEVSAQRGEAGDTPPALHEYVRARLRWLETQGLRHTRLYLFYSQQRPGSSPHSPLGFRMLFADLAAVSRERHEAALGALKSMRTALKARLEAASLGLRELGVGELQALLHSLLNPTHAEKRWAPHPIQVRDNLYADETLAHTDASLREYTEAEQLVAEDLVEERGALRQEGTWRRALSLKVLPEGGTGYLAAEPLLGLVEPKGDDVLPFPFWLSVSVTVEHQARQRLRLNAAHNLVGLVAEALPLLKGRSASGEAEDRARRHGIEGLFEELASMASKVVSLSVTLLLDAPSREALEARTEAARAAFNRAGNAELLLEEVSQLPAFLSVLPGSGPYQHRKKTCTSRNAADLLPVFAPSRGAARASSLVWTPNRDVFRFDFFDSRLPAHHGLVWADTGSGKSVTLGAFTLDALAAGHDAILVDHGRSWQRLTHLLGGLHLDVDIKTPLTPFLSLRAMSTPAGELDAEAIEDVVTYLELCVRDADLAAFNKLQLRVVAAAVRHAYLTHFQAAPDERPLMRHFRDALRAVGAAPGTHPDDRAIAESLHRRLGLFVGDEQYGTFLDRPSTLRLDGRLICFEMDGVAKGGAAKSIAFATVMRAIAARARSQRQAGASRRTLVEIDEGHTWLGQDETAERFLETAYRTMRKHGVAMWLVSQGLEDFQSGRAGRAILANSAYKFLLFHAQGHGPVAKFFGLTERAEAAFRNLRRRPGHYADLLLLQGQRVHALRLALHPLALWMLTTAKGDAELLERARAKNPHLDAFALVRHLARHFPHGAPDESQPFTTPTP